MTKSFFWLSISEKFRARRYGNDLNILLELLSPEKNDEILDVGAGTGWIANRIASVCDETYALEPNESRLDFMKAKYPSVKAFSATAQSVPFPEKYFNKIYIIFAFHHIPDQEDALEEFRRILKPKGILLIHEYYDRKPGLGGSIERRIMKSNRRFLNPEDLENIVKSHGFQVETLKDGHVGYFLLAKGE